MSNPWDHSHPPARVTGAGGTDSAGEPWGGRSLEPTGFEGDDGTADPALAAVLARPVVDAALVRAVAAARLLVPLVPCIPDDGDPDAHASLATATLVAPDGSRALPAFTSLDALERWRRDARPVPMTPARAAQAAVAEGCDVIVLDVAGPHPAALRPSMVWALAMQREWLPAQEDPVVDRAVAMATRDEPEVMAYGLEGGEPSGTLRVVLTLVPGLSQRSVSALATRIGERLATDGELRARVDGLAFSIR